MNPESSAPPSARPPTPPVDYKTAFQLLNRRLTVIEIRHHDLQARLAGIEFSLDAYGIQRFLQSPTLPPAEPATRLQPSPPPIRRPPRHLSPPSPRPTYAQSEPVTPTTRAASPNSVLSPPFR